MFHEETDFDFPCHVHPDSANEVEGCESNDLLSTPNTPIEISDKDLVLDQPSIPLFSVYENLYFDDFLDRDIFPLNDSNIAKYIPVFERYKTDINKKLDELTYSDSKDVEIKNIEEPVAFTPIVPEATDTHPKNIFVEPRRQTDPIPTKYTGPVYTPWFFQCPRYPIVIIVHSNQNYAEICGPEATQNEKLYKWLMIESVTCNLISCVDVNVWRFSLRDIDAVVSKIDECGGKCELIHVYN